MRSPSLASEEKRVEFRRSVVEPHMAACQACQNALANIIASEDTIAKEFWVEEQCVELDEALKGQLVADVEADEGVRQGELDYLRGRYYSMEEAICSLDCEVLTQIFQDYFATL